MGQSVVVGPPARMLGAAEVSDDRTVEDDTEENAHGTAVLQSVVQAMEDAGHLGVEAVVESAAKRAKLHKTLNPPNYVALQICLARETKSRGAKGSAPCSWISSWSKGPKYLYRFLLGFRYRLRVYKFIGFL